jgi:hypothetical protein
MSDNPTNSPVITQVQRLKAAQAARELAELRRLVTAFKTVHDAAQRQADALALAIEAKGGTVTQGQLVRMKQYRALLEVTQAELDKYNAFVGVEMNAQTKLSIGEGEKAARLLTRLAAAEGGVDVQALMKLNPDVIEQLVGFLDPKGPLYQRLDGLPKWTADQMSQAIIEGVGMGKNPRVIAGIITNTLGMGLTNSMRMMRTAQLWSYREANRASYVANADVVAGWVWHAELDKVTCASCVVMHGTEHPLSEPLNDHHNGRCAMVPMVVGAKNTVAPGADWFDSSGEATQKAILGQSKWDAWKEGKFALADVSGVNKDPVYGDMRIERSLKALLSE